MRSQSWSAVHDGRDEEPPDGTPPAGREDQLVALELRSAAPEHGPKDESSNRPAGPGDRLPTHRQSILKRTKEEV